MDRARNIDRLSDPFDVAIIGGGATGLGAAVEAAARGYRTVLLEARDFAQGTSSRSTKLVHGGVRYLAQGNVGLVREALLERGRLRRNAPHLVGDLEFVVPAYAWWSGPYYGVGLKLYDVLAGRHRLGTSQLLSRAQVLERIPTLEPDQLKGGVRYFDGQFDDARLAVTLALTADELGAVLVNHAAVVAVTKAGGKVRGVRVRDEESGREHEVQAGVVINATGVFADEVRRMDEPGAVALVAPSQGVHLVLPDAFLPGAHALMIPRTDDGRVLFVVPWHKRALVGTTDTPVPRVSVEPRPLEEEIAFLLDHAARYLSRDPTPEDVLSVYVGLRPLVRAEGATRTATDRRASPRGSGRGASGGRPSRGASCRRPSRRACAHDDTGGRLGSRAGGGAARRPIGEACCARGERSASSANGAGAKTEPNGRADPAGIRGSRARDRTRGGTARRADGEASRPLRQPHADPRCAEAHRDHHPLGECSTRQERITSGTSPLRRASRDRAHRAGGSARHSRGPPQGGE